MGVCLGGVFFISCQHKQSSSEETSYIAPPSMDYSANDTTEIMALVDQYIQCLNEQDYDGMVDLLYVFKDNRIYPYVGHQRDSLKRGFMQIPIYGAKLNSFTLRSNVNNEVGIKILFVPGGDLNEDRGVSKFFLNPVLVKGKWYLTLLDTHAEGYRNVYNTGH